MSEFLEKLGAAIEARLRGSFFRRLLEKLNIHPKRFWLLMDLFHKLSKREEMQGQLGRQTYALRFSAAIFLVLTAIASVIAVIVGAPAVPLIVGFLALTALTLVAVLLSEAANSLVNAEEALALAHQPINGATYTAAKLSHLLRIVVHYVLGWNLLPALASPFLRDGRWFYPMLHLAAAFTLGTLLALFCCSLFGLVMRVVPARRMKAAAQFVQAVPIVIFGFLRFSPSGTLRRIADWGVWITGPLALLPIWLLTGLGIGLACAVVIVGVRSLSSDYLIRVSSMVHGSSNARTRVRRSPLGEIVRRAFGGQASRAGFDYIRRMMARDWQFRRQMLELMPLMALTLIGMFSAGLPSPFSQTLSSAHFIPHVLGFLLYNVCLLLPYGTDYKGVWLFLLVSESRMEKFCRGVHASMWLTFIAVPNVLFLGIGIWRWGIAEALVYVVYSVAATSVYLAIGIRVIDGVPFGKQVSPGRTNPGRTMFRMLAFVFGALAAAALQYLLFRSYIAVWVAAAVVGAAAIYLTRLSIRTLHSAMRYHLSVASQTSTMVYTEVGTERTI